MWGVKGVGVWGVIGVGVVCGVLGGGGGWGGGGGMWGGGGRGGEGDDTKWSGPFFQIGGCVLCHSDEVNFFTYLR